MEKLSEGNVLRENTLNIDGNSIELLSSEDEVIKENLNRPLINLYDLLKDSNFINNKLSLALGWKNGIYLNDFEFDPNEDIKTIKLKDSSDTIITKYFLRVSPGVALLQGENLLHYPTLLTAERQLEKILSLKENENIKIFYNNNYDKFKIQIKKGDTIYNYSNYDNFGDSSSGFDTGIEALLEVYGDSDNFSEFKDTIYENIEKIKLEEFLYLNIGDSIFIGFNDEGKLIGDTFNVFFPLYHIKTELYNNELRIIEYEDLRESIQGSFINRELILNGDFYGDSFPTLDDGFFIDGNGTLTTTNSDYYGTIKGDTISGLLNSNGNITLYFSEDIDQDNFRGFINNNIYRFSIKIKLNGTNHNNVSFNLYEYTSSTTKITSDIARNISDWQELIIYKKIDDNTLGVNVGINLNSSDSIFIDNISVKNLGRISGDQFVNIKNIIGDTLLINTITYVRDPIGDSKITFYSRIEGDTLVFDTMLVDRFLGKLNGDTISVDTSVLDNLKSKTGDTIILLSKLMGDTICLDTLQVENILGRGSYIPPEKRRSEFITTTSSVYNFSTSDEGKTLIVNGSGNKTINLPNLNTGDSGFDITVIKNYSNNLITINPNSNDQINGDSIYNLTDLHEAVTIRWSGNAWFIISIGLDFPLNALKGGTGVTSLNAFKRVLQILSEDQGDSKYAFKRHTHSQYLTSIPSQYLTENEGNTRYYTKTQFNNLITGAKNDIVDGAPSDLNTLNKLAAAINDDPDFHNSIGTTFLSKDSADKRYGERILFTGSRIINKNGDTLILPVNTFTNDEFRWLKVTYKENDIVRTGKYKASDLVQNFPITLAAEDNELYTVNLRSIISGTVSRVHSSNVFGNGDWESLTSHGGTVYVINDSNNALYTVNTNNGTVSRVHATNTLGNGDWKSLASQGGLLYTINDSNNALYTINTTPELVSRVNDDNNFGSGDWKSLVIHNGTLYAINDSTNTLYTVNNSDGTASLVHNTNTFGAGDWESLASNNKDLYTVNNGTNTLYIINTTDGTVSRAHATNTFEIGSWGSLAFHNGILYTVNDSNDALYFVNLQPLSGTVSRVHATNNFGEGDWGGLSSHNDVLYTVNTQSIIPGTVSRVHSSNTLGSGDWESLTSHDGKLYTVNDSNDALYTVNSTNGTVSRVSSNRTLGSGIWSSLAFQGGTLYCINNRDNALYTVNTTNGTVSRVHSSNTLGTGDWKSLASQGGILYCINDNNNALYTVNATNGIASRVHSSNVFGNGDWESLASHGGTLYCINDSNNALYTVNATNGIASRVHNSNTLIPGDSGVWDALTSVSLDLPGDSRQVLVTPGDSRRVLDTPGDSRQVVDTPGDSRQVVDVPGDSRRVLDTAGDSRRVLDTAGDSRQVLVTPGDSRQVLDTPGDSRRVLDTPGDSSQRVLTTPGDSRRVLDTPGDSSQRVLTTPARTEYKYTFGYFCRGDAPSWRASFTSPWAQGRFSPNVVATERRRDSAAENACGVGDWFTGQHTVISRTVPAVYRTVIKQPTYKTVRTQPTYRTVITQPVYRTEKTQPTYRTERTQPTYRTDKTEPTYRTERTQPTYRTDKTEPTYRTERTQPTYRTDKTEPTYRIDKTQPVYKKEVNPPGTRNILYTINDSNNALYTINTTSGIASRVHSSNTFGNGDWESLASHGDTLYTINDSNNALYKVNINNGTASRVHATNTFGKEAGNWESLASQGGTLYTINDSNNALYTINTTNGTATRINSSNNLGNGNWKSLAFYGGTLYTINDSNNALYTINTTNGTSSRVHSSNTLGSGSWKSLVSQGGTLYAVNDNNDIIYTVNTNNGTASRVHNTNTFGNGDWESLASHGGTLYTINDDNNALYTIDRTTVSILYSINTTDGTASRVHATNNFGTGDWESASFSWRNFIHYK